MPNNSRPGVVEHPLNDSSRFVFVAAVGFEHRAFTFVGDRLRLPRIVGRIACRTVAAFERVGIEMDVFELAAARVEIPVFVNGPKLVWGDHFLQSFERWNGRTRTSLRVETIGPAIL